MVAAAVPEDAEALAVLERQCYSHPWTRRHFEQALADPRQVVLVARDAWEPGDGRGIVAYCALAVVTDEIQIHNLAVRSDARRQGLARLLLAVGLDVGARRGGRRALLEVRASNAAALTLYREAGFLPVARRKGYYSGPPEDAIVMRRDALPPPPAASEEP
jgi:ribosomal-protein-alanine N-acetyltransferase